MDRLLLMNAPSGVEAGKEKAAFTFLERLVASDPNITWGQLREASAQYLEGVRAEGMNGWLTNGLKAVGRALDPFTLGGASKLLIGTRNVVSDVFDSKKVKDSLKEAASGVGDDALDRFIDALPFGIGDDLKVGHIARRVWLIGGIVLAVAFFIVWRSGKKRRK